MCVSERVTSRSHPKREQAAPTLATIARLAGVSHSTVSLVLNERGEELRIHPDTQERVRRIARDLNYVPNHLARGLRGLKTRAIGVLWSLGGPHPSQGIARTITLLAQKHGYTAHLADSLSDPSIILKMLEDLARRRIDGVIIQLDRPYQENPSALKILDQLTAFSAVVLVSSVPFEDGPFDQVVHDQTGAFEAMARALMEAGRSRVAFLGENAYKAARLQRSLTEAGCREPLRTIPLAGGTTFLPEAYKALLDESAPSMKDLDAVVCNNDEMATGLLGHLAARGIPVPDKVAVIGFNDSPFAPFLSPPLASVRRHDQQVAERAMELLFERLDSPGGAWRTLEIPMTFVARASSGLACAPATRADSSC